MRINLVALVLLGGLVPVFAGDSLEGTWSVPSLSQRTTPMVFTLASGGKATEEIGTYRGEGTWKIEGPAARIFWDSGWMGMFRPAPKGGYELATWKAKSSPDGPPDDVQPARRIAPEATP